MIDTDRLIEIRWHGRGGQGAVTSAEMLARAAILEGKYAQAFPAFGPERRGAPVLAFVRIDSKESVKIRAEITKPDVVVVLDPGLLSIINVAAGLKDGGVVIVNTKDDVAQLRKVLGKKCVIATVDASRIAREVLGVPITNTTMVGAVVKATEVVNLKSLDEPLQHRFGRLAEKNIEAVRQGYEQTSVKG